VDSHNYSGDLRGNRRGVHRGDCADRVQVNADIAFLRRDGGDGDAGGTNFLGGGFFGFFVVAENQQGNNHKDQK